MTKNKAKRAMLIFWITFWCTMLTLDFLALFGWGMMYLQSGELSSLERMLGLFLATVFSLYMVRRNHSEYVNS